MKKILTNIKRSIQVKCRSVLKHLFSAPPLNKNDAIICLCVFILALGVGFAIGYQRYVALSENGLRSQASWYQTLFSPSLGEALSGTPTEKPKRGINDRYDRIMSNQGVFTDTFDSISLDQVKQIPTEHIRFSALGDSLWLITYSTSGLWKSVGIASWGMLLLLYGISFGITAVCAYLLFRMAGSVVPALLATNLYIMSFPILRYFLNYRDFSRMPGLLLVCLLILLLQRGKLTAKRYCKLGIIFGVLLGLCTGLRDDFLVLLPLAWVSALMMHPTRNWRRNLGCGSIFIVCFLIGFGPFVAWEKHLVSRRDTHWHGFSPHVMGIGLNDYEKIPMTTPDYAQHMVWRSDPATRDMFAIPTFFRDKYKLAYGQCMEPEYDAVGKDYLLQVYLNYPADFVLRSWSIALSRLQALFHESFLQKNWLPGYLGNWLQFNENCLSFKHWNPAIFIFAATWLFIAAFRFKAALFGLFTTLWLLCVPVAQYQERHYFGYGFIILFFALLLVTQSGRILCLVLRYRHRLAVLLNRKRRWKYGRNILSFILIFLTGWAISIYGLRFYQQRHLAKIYGQYQSWPSENLPVEFATKKANIAQMTFPTLSELQKRFPENEAVYVKLNFHFDKMDLPESGTESFSMQNGEHFCRKINILLKYSGDYSLITPILLKHPGPRNHLYRAPKFTFPETIHNAFKNAELWSQVSSLPHYPSLLWLDHAGRRESRQIYFNGSLF